jgi:glycosyltransferase involved in cell wall biosynthesis
MRISLVNPYLFQETPGGIERELVMVANALDDMGDSVAVVTSRFRHPEGRAATMRPCLPLRSGVAVSTFDGWGRGTWFGLNPSLAPVLCTGLRRTVANTAPDAVIFFNSGWPLQVLPAMLGLKRFCTIGYRTYFHDAHQDGFRAARAQHMMLATLGRADVLFAATNQERDQLRQLRPTLGNRTVVVPPGVSWRLVDDQDCLKFRARMGIERDALLILHVGRLGAFKGTDKLIQAFAELRRQNAISSGATLMLVGAIVDQQAVWPEILRQRVAANTRVLADASEEDLQLAYAAADLFVLPSRYESLGFVYLEALAHGTPVIGVRTGGVAEIVEQNGVGTLLDAHTGVGELARTIRSVLANPTLMKQQASKGRQMVRRQFTWESTAWNLRQELLDHTTKRTSSSS